MYILENAKLKAGFDESARLVWLENKARPGNTIAAPMRDAVRVVCKKAGDWEHVCNGADQVWEIGAEKEALTFRCQSLKFRKATEDMGLVLRVRIQEDELLFSATIDNRTDNLLVTDIEYPRIGMIDRLGDAEPDLLAPYQSGMRLRKVGRYLAGLEPSRDVRPAYEINYAGDSGSMHWMALCGGGDTLYAASHDDKFHTAQMRAEGGPDGHVGLIFSLNPFVKPGETWDLPVHPARLYTGSWHEGADAYAAWASTWRKPVERPEWIRRMQGYFLVINKQQYGQKMWRYDELPKLYEMAREHGCETLGLFGWYESGHDNKYPDQRVDESLGDREALTKGIQDVHDLGGRVTLYQQGHLIDISSDYYARFGDKYASRSRHGVPYMENYYKSHESGFLNRYTAKHFAISCPSCPEWRELMLTKADYVASFGADAALYDQIGGLWSYPCFNDEHPHDEGRPSLSMTGGRRKLLPAIHKRTKELGPDFAFMSEHINDLYSQYLDFLHGMHLLPSEEGWYLEEDGEPGIVNEPALFRYCFPDVRMTIRNGRPHLPVRMVNYAFTFGLAYEMELRYDADRADILADKWPEERAYAKAVAALREKYADELFLGIYRDDRPLTQKPRNIIAKVFETDDAYAVTLWNDSPGEQPLELDIAGARLMRFDTAGGAGDSLPKTLPARSIAIAKFKKG